MRFPFSYWVRYVFRCAFCDEGPEVSQEFCVPPSHEIPWPEAPQGWTQVGPRWACSKHEVVVQEKSPGEAA